MLCLPACSSYLWLAVCFISTTLQTASIDYRERLTVVQGMNGRAKGASNEVCKTSATMESVRRRSTCMMRQMKR